MIYVIFYNPEAKELQCESNKDYHEIRYYAGKRGVSETDFKVISHRWCSSKKQIKKFADLLKTSKMTRLLGKTLLVATCILMSNCIVDKHNANGRLVKMDGKYYRLDCRAGNVYALELIQMDTIFVYK